MLAKEKLEAKIKEGKHITVGLDPDIKKIPSYLLADKDPVYKFNQIIIDNTAKHCAAFKLNFAFFEKDGSRGLDTLMKTIEYIPEDILIIADAKRGDIANTSQMYADSIFGHFKADAVTLHPYMGFDSLEPFINYKEKLNFILALTSNKGSADFEKLRLQDGSFLFQKVIGKALEWNSSNNCGIVFGATNQSELNDNIDLFGDMFVLLPGIGAQGGDLREVVDIFREKNKANFTINVSRSLLYKDNSDRFGIAAKEEIVLLNNEVDSVLSKSR